MQTEDIIPMDQILEKQKELEAKAPHEVSAISYNLMDLTIKEMKSLLVFINSTGRKPWRPNPLSKAEISRNLEEWLSSQEALLEYWEFNKNSPPALKIPRADTYESRLMISTLGIIEEALEFYQEMDIVQPDMEKALEEITDILFFYMVSMIGANITWEQIIERYQTKWKENMGRYRKLESGDISWDKRSEKGRSL